VALVVGGLLPPDDVTGLAAVAVDGPDVLLHEAAGVALQRPLAGPGRDLPVQRARRHGQLDEEQRRRARPRGWPGSRGPGGARTASSSSCGRPAAPVAVLAQQRHHLASGREHGMSLNIFKMCSGLVGIVV
jgi:hypothetical protein